MGTLRAPSNAHTDQARGDNDIVPPPARAGNSYLWRAVIALIGLGANLPDDAIYPILVHDSEGHKLASPNKYVLTFPEGQLPPVGAFWSVTLYDGVSRRARAARDPVSRGEASGCAWQAAVP